MPEYAQGGLIERGNSEPPAWILDHDCGPIIRSDQVKLFGNNILRRINEAHDNDRPA